LKTPRIFAVVFWLAAIAFSPVFIAPARAEDVPPAVTTIITAGGDDVSYRVPLTVSVIYDGVTYDRVYATTNSVITFGNPDNTFHTYPATPSISIESRDWWALPQQMPDTHFIINVSEGGFQVDGAYRPYGSFVGNVTNIIVTAQIQTDGTVAYTYATSGPLWGDERTGARLTDGTVVTLEEAGVTQVEEPTVLEPTPVEPTPEPTPVEPTPEPIPVEPNPEPIPDVVNPPIYPVVIDFVPVETDPVTNQEQTPQETPTEEPTQVIEPLPIPVDEPSETITDLEPAPAPVEPVVDESESEPIPSEPPMVVLDNGVSLTPQIAAALALFENPADMLSAIFTNPAEVLTAIGNIGADMSPEVREKAETIVIASIIAGNIATSAAVSASTAAAYRRKP
jgi:hypothetical protein